MKSSAEHVAITETYSAHNYAPIDVVISRGEGVWVYDVEGRRYLDMLSAYSALNFGHCHPRLVRAAENQIGKLTLTSRAFYNDQFGPFCQALAELCRMEMVLAMNSGAEAVESAIKIARRWAYSNKLIPADQAEIITFAGNFHGRTTTVISFSDSDSSRHQFGPFTPGFRVIDYGDADALAAAISERTAAVLIEPIQGEGGVILPPDGFLRRVRELCDRNRVLMIADEIQTGLCRTGRLFACDWEDVTPDLYILGKSLGGGLVPISAVVGRRAVMEVLTPGSHGSTFGGNPFACAIALEVIDLIRGERPEERAREMGAYFIDRLRLIRSEKVAGVRGRGLLIGVDVSESYGKAKRLCRVLKEHGILCKDTRDHTLRFAPPLFISTQELDTGLDGIRAAFTAAEDPVH